jgi:predicted metal-dependent hydrolase
MEKHRIIYNNESIEFTLIRKSVKNINLRVKADLSVVVSAGKNVPLSYIIEFITKKAQWIQKSLDKYSRTKTEIITPPKYVNGEVYALFGRKLRLKVIVSSDDYVELQDKTLLLCIKDEQNLDRKKALLDNFYRDQFISYISISLEKMLDVIQRVERPEVIIKKMKSRWGSCFVHRNTIVLNAALIYAPKLCIDYVVLHELLHFSIPNHSKIFYSALTKYMPEWKEAKKTLNGINIRSM